MQSRNNMYRWSDWTLSEVESSLVRFFTPVTHAEAIVTLLNDIHVYSILIQGIIIFQQFCNGTPQYILQNVIWLMTYCGIINSLQFTHNILLSIPFNGPTTTLLEDVHSMTQSRMRKGLPMMYDARAVMLQVPHSPINLWLTGVYLELYSWCNGPDYWMNII